MSNRHVFSGEHSAAIWIEESYAHFVVVVAVLGRAGIRWQLSKDGRNDGFGSKIGLHGNFLQSCALASAVDREKVTCQPIGVTPSFR